MKQIVAPALQNLKHLRDDISASVTYITDLESEIRTQELFNVADRKRIKNLEEAFQPILDAKFQANSGLDENGEQRHDKLKDYVTNDDLEKMVRAFWRR